MTTGTLPLPPALDGATLRRVRFVPRARPGDEVLLDFTDPVPRQAVYAAEGDTEKDGLDVWVVATAPSDTFAWGDDLLQWVAAGQRSTTAPTAITMHGALVVWGGARALLMAAPERVQLFLTALVDFSYHDGELRRLEREVAADWPLLEGDAALACQMEAADRRRAEEARGRMEQALLRRIRLARIEPHLHQPRPHFTPLANQMLDRLRERAHVEGRLEAIASQMEVSLRLYEMSSQRVSDFRHARGSYTLEWVIIILLGAETILLLIELLVSLQQ